MKNKRKERKGKERKKKREKKEKNKGEWIHSALCVMSPFFHTDSWSMELLLLKVKNSFTYLCFEYLDSNFSMKVYQESFIFFLLCFIFFYSWSEGRMTLYTVCKPNAKY